METAERKKTAVRDTYSRIAQGSQSCCGPSSGCGDPSLPAMAEDYSQLEGYAAEADLQLGCGIPLEAAQIAEGSTVADLGAGAGNDAFVLSRAVGSQGRVIGVDFTPEMLAKARQNADKLGYKNVEFVEGDIENLPLKDEQLDAVVSNCVMNLVPDKARAYAEAFRVVKPGGHIAISDIVLGEEPLPGAFLQDAALYAGCVSGALAQSEYLGLVKTAGFRNLQVVKSKNIRLPEEIFQRHGLQPQAGAASVRSITLYAEKPQD